MAISTRTQTLVLLFFAVLLAALDIAIVGPALPAIQQSFGLDGRALAWILNIYILFALVGAPLNAKLSDRYGRRAVFVGCLATFAVGSVIVAMAPTFSVLLAGRTVQAFGAGGILPVASAVIADSFPLERRGRALGLIGAVFGLALVLGPILGGVLLRWGWQWLFLINLPILGVVIWLSLRLLPQAPSRSLTSFDWQGAVVMSAMLVALAWGVSQLDAQHFGTSLMSIKVLPFIVFALLAVPVLWRIERHAADPILDPVLFLSKRIRVIGAIAIATGLVEASMVFLPAMSVRAFAVSASTASFMMLPLVAMLIVGAPMAGQLLDRIGPRPVIQAGLLLTVCGLLMLAGLPLVPASFYSAGICIGLGLSGLLGAPLRFVALQEAGEDKRGASQGLLTLFLSIGRMLGAAVIGGMVASGASELLGYRRALFCLAVVCMLAILVSVALRQSHGRTVATGPGT